MKLMALERSSVLYDFLERLESNQGQLSALKLRFVKVCKIAIKKKKKKLEYKYALLSHKIIHAMHKWRGSHTQPRIRCNK